MVRRVVFAIALTGCFSPAPRAGSPCSATGECPTGLVCSATTNTCEGSPTDAPDAMVQGDAALVDGAADDTMTTDAPTSPVIVAHYLFDDDLADETGRHDGSLVGTGMTYVAGRAGANEHAVSVPTLTAAHIVIPDHTDFDIPTGQIDVWFRFGDTAPDGDLGVLSRDANGSSTGGHIGLRIGHDRRLVLRIQTMSSPTIDAYRCTAAALAPATWHHARISFGGSLTMEVNGAATTGTTWTDSQGVARTCTSAWTTGIDGNDNPWVLGALSLLSNEGTGAPVSAPAGTLQIDELVIRRLP